MKSPLVSVVMSVYNEERYIVQAVDSILNQTFENFELIIINDGSTDATDDLIKSYDDRRVRYVIHNTCKNQAVRANEGIALAQGKYIARMDGDDISLPTRLEKQVAFLEKNENISIVGTQIRTLHHDEKQTYRYKKLPTGADALRAYSLIFSPFIHSTVMVRREVFQKFSYNASYDVAQDFELYSRLLYYYKATNLKEILVHYRVHENNVHKKDLTVLMTNVGMIIHQRFALEGFYLNELQLKVLCLVSESSKQLITQSELVLIKDNLTQLFLKFNNLEALSKVIWRELYWKLEPSAILTYLKIAYSSGALQLLNYADYKYILKRFIGFQ